MKKILWVVIGIPVMAVVWFVVTYQTLSPCEAYKGEVKRQYTEKAGELGKIAGGIVGEISTADWSPGECAWRLAKLKVKGAVDD